MLGTSTHSVRAIFVSSGIGQVAQLVDAEDLKSSGRKAVRVRVPPCPNLIMKIARAGWGFIAMGLGAAFVATLLTQWESLRGASCLLGILSLGFSAFCAYFFRDPERPLPTDAKKLYSPGDGVVMSVSREGPGDTVTLRIFLSIFNVHIQRAPCAGQVEGVEHKPGSFKMAMKDGAKGNERTIMRLKPEAGGESLVVEQIAGAIARRIECWVGEGTRVAAGERYGIIHFGSQAAVHFPASARCTVKPGDKVYGALTEIGEWTS